MYKGHKGFRMFVKFGDPLPQIGEEYQFDGLNDKTETSNKSEFTIKVTGITAVEWDLPNGRILIKFEGYYRIDKQGLQLVKRGNY